MEKTYKMCQSCGMPLKKDGSNAGTEADGSKSRMYCHLCYSNGKFVQPNLTLGQMQDVVKKKMKEMGFIMGLFANKFAKGLSSLERWKS